MLVQETTKNQATRFHTKLLFRKIRMEVQTLVSDGRASVLPFPQLVDVPPQPRRPLDHRPAAMAQLAFLLRVHAREGFRLAVRDEDGVPPEAPPFHGLDDGAGAPPGKHHGIRVRIGAEGEGAHGRGAFVLVPDQNFIQALDLSRM